MTAARRLAAILAADVVGYSRLMGARRRGGQRRRRPGGARRRVRQCSTRMTPLPHGGSSRSCRSRSCRCRLIPHLKITDTGFVDVDRFEFVRD